MKKIKKITIFLSLLFVTCFIALSVNAATNLTAPALTTSNITTSGKISLKWDAVDGASKYQVYRSNSKDGTFKLLKTTTSTSFTNTGANAGETWYYYVVAVDAGGNTSNRSNISSRTCDLPRPTNVKSTNIASTGKMKITWDAVDGASKYYVYRSTSQNGTYDIINTVTATECFNSTDTNVGVQYYYKVKAVHTNSAANSALSGYTSRTCDLPAPKITLSNVESSGKIKITWDAVEGASKYEIYRATSENGTFKLIKTLTGTQFTNTTPVAGKTYWYKVRAIHTNSAANSGYSTTKSRICDLPRPTNVKSSNIASTGKIKITWDAVDGAEKYYVYRSTSQNGTYDIINTVTATECFNSTDTNVGVQYYYKVKAVHSDSTANSALSGYTSRTCDLPAPKITLSNVESSGKIKITWDAVEGASKYEIYRATSENGTFKLIKTLTGTQFTNTTPVAGNTYWYKVRALHTKSAANSGYSTTKSRICDLPGPANLKVVFSDTTGKLTLSWDAVNGAEKYYVYRSTSKNGTYDIISTVTEPVCQTGAPVSGTQYFYKVKAVHSDSTANSALSSYIAYTGNLSAPKLTLSNIPSSGKLHISWDAVEGAKMYEIFRSTQADSGFVSIGTTTATSLTDNSTSAGTTYYYKAKALHTDSSMDSAFSATKYRACDLPAPVNLTVSNIEYTGGMKLVWDAVDGAEKYYVYRSTSKDGTYDIINTVTATECLNSTDTVAGTRYFYRIKALHADSAANSEMSDAVSCVCDLPVPKINLSSDEASGKIIISWDAIEGASKYEIHRSTEAESGFAAICTTSQTTFTDSTAAAGTVYYYKAKALHANSEANSGFSYVKYRTCDLPMPSNVKAENVDATGRIRLTWDAVEGAEKYYIYRSTEENGTFEIINTVTETEYTNISIDVGTKYWYYVVAVHTDSIANSAQSKTVGLTCRLPAPEIFMSVDADSCQTVVYWEAVEGATGYEIFRCGTENGSFASIGTTTDTTFTDTGMPAGELCWYKVKALHSNTAAQSAPSVAKHTISKLMPPSVSITKDENGKPVISWDYQEGAVTYEVYRSVTENGTYRSVFSTSRTKYNNTGACDAVEYFYKVKAVAANEGYSSEMSDAVSVVVGNGAVETFDDCYLYDNYLSLYDEPYGEAYGAQPAVIAKYMDAIEVGANVSESESGSWTRIIYDGKLYYGWLTAGTEHFTDTRSSFEYTSSSNTEIQNAVVEFAVGWKDEPTFYTHGQSEGVLDPVMNKYGFDCSGFASFVLNSVNRQYNPLYTVSKDITDFYTVTDLLNTGFHNQFSVIDVDYADIQPGDIIFFKLDETDPKVMDHCVIYLGNGEFIHATTYPDGVHVMRMTDELVSKIIAVRRYYPDEILPANHKVTTNYEWVYIYPEPVADKETRIYEFQLGEEATMLYSGRSESWCWVRSSTGVEGYALIYRFDKAE